MLCIRGIPIKEKGKDQCHRQCKGKLSCPLDLVATSQRGQTHDDQDRPQLFTPFFALCPVFSVMHELAAR